MNIVPISFDNKYNNTNFCAKRDDNITKKFIYGSKKAINNTTENVLKKAAPVSALASVLIVNAENILKDHNITYCNSNDKVINLASGYNGGFYSINTTHEMSQAKAKEYIAYLLSNNYSALGGLMNYIDFVRDLKRHDIIRQGLKIHTYELNTKVDKELKENTATILSKTLKTDIQPDDMFYIKDEAFYYDKLKKTAYGICLTDKPIYVPTNIRTCEFKISDGNTIGYKVRDWDSYHWRYTDKEYAEQIAPSVKLKPIAEPENNKDFAEAFRFGNSTYHDNYRLKIGMSSALEHLNNKVGITGADQSKLQFVRFYDKNKDIQARICYYDPTIGRSFVYNQDGKYMYQLEYNRDSNGNITACARF